MKMYLKWYLFAQPQEQASRKRGGGGGGGGGKKDGGGTGGDKDGAGEDTRDPGQWRGTCYVRVVAINRKANLVDDAWNTAADTLLSAQPLVWGEYWTRPLTNHIGIQSLIIKLC